MYIDGLVLCCIIYSNGNTVFINWRMHLPIHVLNTVNISMQDFVPNKLKLVKYWERGHCSLGSNLSIWLCVYFLGGGHLRQCVSNHTQLDCLFNMFFQTNSKRTPRLHITSFWEGNPPWPMDFSLQNIVIWKTISCHDIIIILAWTKNLIALFCRACLKGNMKQLTH